MHLKNVRHYFDFFFLRDPIKTTHCKLVKNSKKTISIHLQYLFILLFNNFQKILFS